MQKITPMLWFDSQAEEAAKFYTSVFKNSPNGSLSGSMMGTVTHYSEAAANASGRPAGSAMTASFQLNGQDFIALNGGPHFKFSEAISFVVNCDTQEEIDYFWEKLIGDGGKEVECGWLTDKFGLSWQITPAILPELLKSSPEKSQRVMTALMKMKKLDLAKLKAAAEGK